MRPSQMRSLPAWSVWASAGLVVIAFASRVAAAESRGIFSLIVDQVNKGTVVAVLRPSDVLIPVEDLESAGVKGFAGKRETIRGKPYVSLASLAPQIKYQIDVKAVAIDLTVVPTSLGATTVDLSYVSPPAGLIHARNASFFLNYSVSLNQFTNVSAFGDAGMSLFGNTLLDSTFSVDATGTIHRQLTSLTIDVPEDLRTLVLGDNFIGSPDPLGGGVLVGGVALSRNFLLNPYILQVPSGEFTGALTTPSTVEVYVNGRLVSRQSLPPGLFTLQNIPYYGTSGITRVLVRDAFGNEQEFTQNYYAGLGALARGASDYRLVVGSPRQGLGTNQFGYSGLAFGAAGRYGLTSWFTPGFRLEGNKDLLSGGPSAGFGTPIGTFSASAGASMARASATTAGGLLTAAQAATRTRVSGSPTGYAAQANYEQALSRVSFFAQVQYESAHYSTLSLAPGSDRPTLLASASVTVPLSERLTVTPLFNYHRDRDDGTLTSYGVAAQLRLPYGFTLFFGGTISQQTRVPTVYNLFGGLGIPLGGSTSLTTSFGRTEGGPAAERGTSYGVDLAQSAPLGPGFGYDLDASTGPGIRADLVRLVDHGDRGYYEFDFTRNNHQETSDFLFSGSIVAIDGRWLAGPPIQNSFALLRTGVPDVRGYIFDQPFGRTDSEGDLLVTQNVTSFFADKFGINEHDIPLSYRVDATSLLVAPPFRGGALVRFPVRLVRSILGKLVVQMARRSVIPSFGTLTMTAEGKSFESPIGRDGAFFLDSPPPGSHSATIVFEQGTCSFTIKIPPGKEPFVKLGTLRCTM